MKKIRRRILIPLIATMVAALIGTAGGYLLGCGLALRQAKHRLLQGTDRLIAEQNAFLKESEATLKQMNESPYPYCSNEEMAYFRKMLFQTDFLRDGGHMRDEKVDCSATIEPAELKNAQLRPAYSMPNGSSVFTTAGLMQVRGQITLAIQFGNSFVIINSGAARRVDTTPLQFIVTMTAADRSPGRLMTISPQPSDALFTKDGLSRRGETLYFTVCTPARFHCTTTHMTIPEALRSDRTELTICSTFGALVGAFFGFACSLAYRHSRSMEQQLRRAVNRNGLRLVYQPIVDLNGGHIVGAEALARWTDEDGLPVPPDVFVKIAEECGFVSELTKLVVRRALRDFAPILRSHPDFHLSINVAAADLSNPDFLPMLDQALKKAHVSASSLNIEITESSTAKHGVAMETIRQLSERGHSVHIDDFGTGYSSLSYLHDLAIDTIKIDRTFTQAIGTEAVTVGILPQILAMAKALNLNVIVEGIETGEQAAYFSSSEHSVHAQGWLFGRPVSIGEFRHILGQDDKKTPSPNSTQ